MFGILGIAHRPRGRPRDHEPLHGCWPPPPSHSGKAHKSVHLPEVRKSSKASSYFLSNFLACNAVPGCGVSGLGGGSARSSRVAPPCAKPCAVPSPHSGNSSAGSPPPSGVAMESFFLAFFKNKKALVKIGPMVTFDDGWRTNPSLHEGSRDVTLDAKNVGMVLQASG